MEAPMLVTQPVSLPGSTRLDHEHTLRDVELRVEGIWVCPCRLVELELSSDGSQYWYGSCTEVQIDLDDAEHWQRIDPSPELAEQLADALQAELRSWPLDEWRALREECAEAWWTG